ncbi:MAG: hypothetical protein Q9165_001722 [Trypethelium subeluteriae]
MQEDLAGLFSRNLTLSAPPPPSQVPQFQPPAQPPSDQQQGSRQDAPPTTISLADIQRQPITYASTHYTHSAHTVPRAHSEPRTPNMERIEVFDTLTRNSIDPQSLHPSQLHLYANADADQKLRLLELWRISPPNYGRDIEGPSGAWYGTSLHQEEQMARIRYEHLMEERSMVGHAHRPDETLGHLRNGFEQSGYELLAQREYDQSEGSAAMPLQDLTNSYNRAIDPAGHYNIGGMPEKRSLAEDMENQYGMWAEVREIPSVPHASGSGGMEDEMVM